MSPEEIKIEFLKRRKSTSMVSIAKFLGVSKAAITRTIYRQSVSERIMHAVAEAIEKPVETVFPERFKYYDGQG